MNWLPQWFVKAVDEVRDPEQSAFEKRAASMQGKYTDHQASPYSVRQQIEPLHGPELEAFDFVIEKMAEAHPEAQKQSDLIDFAFDEGFFIVGPSGELRVSKEYPQ